jgi:hypothetical protein
MVWKSLEDNYSLDGDKMWKLKPIWSTGHPALDSEGITHKIRSHEPYDCHFLCPFAKINCWTNRERRIGRITYHIKYSVYDEPLPVQGMCELKVTNIIEF